jgi:stress response protein SCP2
VGYSGTYGETKGNRSGRLLRVVITKLGQVSMRDTVYYGDTRNSNNSIQDSGDEREDDEVGDDETLRFHLDQAPSLWTLSLR